MMYAKWRAVAVLGTAAVTATAACSGGGSPGTTPIASPEPVEIEYVIHGSTPEANVTMVVADGLRQDEGLILPERTDGEHRATYTHEMPAGERVYLSAQNARGAGTVRCTIVASDGRTISSHEATGGHAIATCEGTAR
jgi:hypothetical protein